MPSNSDNRGFAVVASVVILTTIMLVVGVSAARSLIGSRGASVAFNDLQQAQSLAEGCAEAALVELAQDAAYVGNEALTIGADSCTIRPVLPGPPITVETEATKNSRTYRLRVELSDLSPMTVSSWQRVADF